MRAVMMLLFAALSLLSAVAVADNTCPAPKSCAEWSEWYPAPTCLPPMMCPEPIIQREERFRMCWVRGPLLATNNGNIYPQQCIETQLQIFDVPPPTN